MNSDSGVQKPMLGHMLGFSANVMWGLMAPFGKVAMTSISPLMLTTCRVIGAGICFWLLSLIIAPHERVERRDLWRMVLASFFALSINQGLYITGLSMTSPINAAIVTTLLPVFTLVFAFLFIGEPISGKKVFGVALGLIGAIVLILSSGVAGGEGNLLGNILCLSSPICFSIYLTLFKDLSQKYTAVTMNKWMFLTASIVYLPLTIGDFIRLDWSSVSNASIGATAYVVLFGSFVAYLCMMTAQKHIRPTLLSMYNYTAPIVATIAAVCLGNGEINLIMLFSMGLIFVGVYFVSLSRSKGE